MTSISRNLVASTLIGALVLILGQLLVLYFVERGELMAKSDEGLEQQAESLATLFRLNGQEIEFGFDELLIPETARHTGVTYYQAWGEDGEVITRSPSLGMMDLPSRFGQDGRPELWNLRLPDESRGRAVGQEFAVHQVSASAEQDGHPTSERVILVVARETDSIRSTLWRFILTDSLVALCGGVVFAIYLVWVIRSLLRPMTKFGEYVEGLEADKLAEPLPALSLPKELTPIAASFARMQQRLDESFQRERRTASSMAHELRTPVSELLTMSDVALLHADEPELALEYLGEVREVALHMRDLISTMLSVARLQLSPGDLKPCAIQCAKTTLEAWRAYEEKAVRKRIRMTASLDQELVVSADEPVLRSILSNLLANAVEYTSDEGELEISLSREGEQAVLRVKNTCAGLEAGDMARLTEFFWRHDGARSVGDGHVGLGLAVSKELASVSGMELELSLEESTFIATLRIELDSSAIGEKAKR